MRVAASGAALTLCVLAWWRAGDLTRDVAGYLSIHLVAFAAYLLALTAAPRLGRRGLAAALLLAGAWRVALALGPPALSDDVYRSVWEGRVQLAGGNPYAWGDRPEAERWRALRDDVWRGVNHKHYTAIYPPLWQLAARAVVAADDSVVAVKLCLVASELLAWWALVAALRARGQPAGRVLVLAWSPLAIVEIAGSGHNDALGLLFLALALLALARGRASLAAASAALGALVKLLPAAIAVAWWRRWRPRDAVIATAIGVAATLPYADAGLTRSLEAFSRHWLFNETLFVALRAAAGSHAGGVALAGFAVLGVAAYAGWRDVDPAAGGLAVVAALLVVSPNVLPWYGLWLLPLLVLRDAPAALLFTGTVSLAYLVLPAWQSGEPWRLGWQVRLLEYAPCALVALWQAARRGHPRLGA